MDTVELGILGIVIFDSTNATIHSDMKMNSGNGSAEVFNAAAGGLEQLILAHYCAGIDVTLPVYIEGIETAYSTLGNTL
ncbi:hypothetical protein [Moritella sp. F3]|uniref:hypothetical protein n=1 Tax=Moritella sp. F3 TaxID=2718882 RepID=UPI0018E1145C|nr:hypothetical protein [Moritella sp. F3]GIC77091.1 hypothetical protein FMO001_18180 [Moritella sp. F1]GIC82210.1 hypothetical protein FMO003_24910 [Moritella sp. F3]